MFILNNTELRTYRHIIAQHKKIIMKKMNSMDPTNSLHQIHTMSKYWKAK
jgi:hypothetical protein